MTGFDRMERVLLTLGDRVGRKVISQALRAGAKVIQAGVVAEVPVGRTKRLRRAIRVRAMKRKAGRVGMMVSTAQGFFQGNTFYGGFVHFGHGIGKRTANKDLGLRERKRRTRTERWAAEDRDAARVRVPANPFVARGFDAKQVEARGTIMQQLTEGVIREAKSA